MTDKAKQYSQIKYSLAIIDVVYLVALLLLFQGPGLSQKLALNISEVVKPYLILPAYILVISIAYYILDFPLNFYRSFIL